MLTISRTLSTGNQGHAIIPIIELKSDSFYLEIDNSNVNEKKVSRMSRVYKTQQRGTPWSAMTVAGDGMRATGLDFCCTS